MVLGLVVATHIVVAFISGSPAMHTGGDNAAYLSLAHSLARDGAYAELWHPGSPPHTQYPPVYPGALALLMLLGAKSWGLFKTFSLVSTALATAFCFLWVRRLHGVRIAGVIALFFGVSPAVLYYSQWILSEPLFVTVVFASLWLLTPKLEAPVERTDPKRASPLPSRPECVTALALVIAAYFTRSAGLPLVAAVGVWLAIRRHWVTLGSFLASFVVLAAPWQLRSGGQYVSAFWMVNPYAHDEGTIGPWGLVARIGENLWNYTTDYVPTGLTGMSGVPAAILGVLMVGFALAGWLRRVRFRPGVPEIFSFFYTGLIMAWPAVWSGDRFALPLFPLILLYAGEQLIRAAARLPRRAAQMVAVAVAAVFMLPAGSSWLERADQAGQCRVLVATSGPMGCYGSNVRELQAMAVWTREWLPPGSVVFARKPTLFYAFSGHPSVVYPFTSDTRSLLVQADSIGVDYLVLGNWDSTGARYVLPAISANPDRFCLVKQLQVGASRISLLAIRAPESDDTEEQSQNRAGVQNCLSEGWNANPSSRSLASMTVPILERE